MLAAGPVSRPRWMTVLAPIAAAAAVIVITGRTTRQWGIGGLTSTGAGTLGIWGVSVSRDGGMVAFVTQSQVTGDTVWALPTRSAPGAIPARARQMYQAEPRVGPDNRAEGIDSALISPDGTLLYLATSAISASGDAMISVTAYSTAGGASPSLVTTLDLGSYRGLGESLTPTNDGMLLAWSFTGSTAYLINPATRTRTTLQLHGVPVPAGTASWQVNDVFLAW